MELEVGRRGWGLIPRPLARHSSGNILSHTGSRRADVSWEKAEAIRKMVSSKVPTSRHHGAPKHGDALLAGLLRSPSRRAGLAYLILPSAACSGHR
jgi:hypothetical protein